MQTYKYHYKLINLMSVAKYLYLFNNNNLFLPLKK